MNDATNTTMQTYRGLVMRVRVFIEGTEATPSAGPWGYEVSIHAGSGDTRLSGLLHHVSPYGSREAAERAGVQRGQLTIDLLRGPLA
ncbi:hypothetical protein [Cupriavidus pauculus]|uniref:hypothetical protein n=1 Tax=Cupriavidus pauculus TaxID=82633 RepID=UPI001EE35CA1|nr:hypothetical protein [Cupriavidus pauculus]GJG98163.1 hypothetical protein CBA19C6_26760 [Cupriavidus pauculus]